MIKKRTLVLFILLPLVVGYVVASHHIGEKGTSSSTVYQQNILSTDELIYSDSGTLVSVSSHTSLQVTRGQHLIEPVSGKNWYMAIDKEENYSSLLQFSSIGQLNKTVYSGKTNSVDTMSWITDPSVNSSSTVLAYVSDRDRLQNNVPDNGLYLLNLSTWVTTNIVKPDPYSGGIAHPVWDPENPNILFYDYYQYAPQTLTPYSTVTQYNITTGEKTPLTTTKQNAFQSAISPSGKQVLYLQRDSDTTTVTMYIATFGENGLSSEHALLSGDLAYPVFSYTSGHIYYLEAVRNKGYNMMTATIAHNKLINVLPVTSGDQLLGNSSFTVTHL